MLQLDYWWIVRLLVCRLFQPHSPFAMQALVRCSFAALLRMLVGGSTGQWGGWLAAELDSSDGLSVCGLISAGACGGLVFFTFCCCCCRGCGDGGGSGSSNGCGSCLNEPVCWSAIDQFVGWLVGGLVCWTLVGLQFVPHEA